MVTCRKDLSRKADAVILGAGLISATFFIAFPAVSAQTTVQKNAAATGQSFVDDFATLDMKRWYVSDGWNNGNHQNCTWSKKEVKVADGVLSMSFQKERFKDRDYICSEIQTRQRFGYGTYEIRMRAASGSGLNSAFFTYIGPTDKQPHDEIDFEVLGKHPDEVQINQFVNGKNVGPEKLVPVQGGADNGFHDYAFVWEKGRIRWYVDGVMTGEATDPAKIPTHPSKIFASLWGSDTLSSWMGKFAAPAEPVTMQVKRIAFTALGAPCQFPQSVACKLH